MSAPQRRYRVLFHIRQVGVGGIENALLGWLQALDREHFDIDVSVALPTRELDTYQRRLPPDVTVHVLVPQGRLTGLIQQRRDHALSLLGRLALGSGMSLWGQPRIAEGLRRLAPNYDLVVDFDLTLRKMAGSLSVPVVGVRHFGFWARRTNKARRVGRDLARYAGVAVLNEAMRAQAADLYGHTLRHVFVLPNAFDLSAMRRQAVMGDPPATQGDYVVSVARLEMATKGQDTLLRAWAHLRQHHPLPGCRLVLVGNGPDLDAIMALRESLGLQNEVIMAGTQRNPFRWMRWARASVLASRSEGAPNVLIEAMATGCMVVSTDCPVGPREILQDGRAGLLVPMDDVPALAHAIWRAVADTRLREDCMAAARARIAEYDIPAGNQRFLAMVQTLVGHHGSATPSAASAQAR